jgi:hypothetical protein
MDEPARRIAPRSKFDSYLSDARRRRLVGRARAVRVRRSQDFFGAISIAFVHERSPWMPPTTMSA